MSVFGRANGRKTNEIKALILLLLYYVLFYGTTAFHSPYFACLKDPAVVQHQQRLRLSDDNANDAGGPPTEDIPTVRPRNVRFVSPLLEYGYPPAVIEYENKTLAQKPLLLYLPGFDGTFLRSVRSTDD
jgi:hypothetical protein